MIKVEALTLEEAFAQASQTLSCSITDLEYEIIQNPSKGFFGFFKKNAIIVAQLQKSSLSTPSASSEGVEKSVERHTTTKETSFIKQPQESSISKDFSLEKTEVPFSQADSNYHEMQREASIENFYKEKIDIFSVLPIIAQEIDLLFSQTCFELNPVEVDAFDETTLLVKFTGSDAALLIGKDGYRYKALSYMLYNWLNTHYGFGLRLEIAEFLHNQEEMIRHYLEPVKEAIRTNGKAQTKILDGILIQIALKELRDTFPDKYIAVKENHEGGKFIIIGPFLRRESF